MNTPLGQIFIEALRWAVMGAISILVTQLLVLLPGIQQTPNVMMLTLILRFIDAALHKSGYAEKGITRF